MPNITANHAITYTNDIRPRYKPLIWFSVLCSLLCLLISADYVIQTCGGFILQKQSYQTEQSVR